MTFWEVWTPDAVGSLFLVVGLPAVSIVSVAVVLVRWADAYKAKWGK